MSAMGLGVLSLQLSAIKVQGDENLLISGLASISQARQGEITFLSDSRYRDSLKNCHASAVVLTEADLPFCPIAAIVVESPYAAYAKLAQIFDTTPKPAKGIASSAIIATDVIVEENVSIGEHAVIESGVVLGAGTSIGAGCFIGKNARIGKNTTIWSNVSIYHGVIIGDNCLIQANTVIGSDGFGYANAQGKWSKIPQLGSVRIGNNVEIGSCTTIDRGALDDTIIEDGVIIDNLCQIAHNVKIGAHTAIAGGVILAGSLTIGRYCMIGGASVINGHMEICDKVTVTGMGMVMRPITEPGIYSSGIPLQPNKVWRKTAAQVLHINELYQRVKNLEKKQEN